MHILQKHLIDADDFNSVNDIIKTIQSVISSGTITRQGTNISLDKDNNRVILAQSPEGTWIVTAYDNSRSRGEKLMNKPDATIGDQNTTEVENGTLVSQQPVPESKGSKRSDKMKFLIQ